MPNTFEIIEENLIALLNARDMKALAIIKAVYEPSLIEAMQCFGKTVEERQRIYSAAMTEILSRSYHFESIAQWFNFLSVKIADSIGPTKQRVGEAVIPAFESTTLQLLKTGFKKIFDRRINYAQNCYHRKDVFDMKLFEGRTAEGKDILREILWCEIVLQCREIIRHTKICSDIEAMQDAIPITEAIFEELFKVDSKFKVLTTLENIKDALFNAARYHSLVSLGIINEV